LVVIGVAELPVVSDELGLQNLPSDHRVAGPAPPVAPHCAFAKEPPSASAAAATAIVWKFYGYPSSDDHEFRIGKAGSTVFQDDPVANVDGLCK
jgi:hypothetical protein